MRFPRSSSSFASLAFWAIAPVVSAQVAPTAAPPPPSPAQPPSVLSRDAGTLGADAVLGPLFDDKMVAMTFRPPVGMKRQPRSLVGADAETVATFLDEAGKRKLTLTQLRFPEQTPLFTAKNDVKLGLLDRRVEGMRQAAPGAEVLRSEPYTIGFRSGKDEPDSGLVAIRFAAGTADVFTQEAVIQVSPYEFYVLDYTVPGAHVGALDPTDGERRAGAVFKAMIETVKMVDRSDVIQDQRERLYRTRYLFFANLNVNRMRNALRPEQWFRVVRDGRDVGYSYVVEEEAEKNRRPGFNTGIRTRVVDAAGNQDDSESFYFVSYDRNYEEWSTLSQSLDPKGVKTGHVEGGTSLRTVHQVIDEGAEPKTSDPKVKRPVLTRPEDQYNLTVVASDAEGRKATSKVEQQLPVFYLPRNVDYLLPRVIPLGDEKSYLFAVYVPEVRSVLRKYVDVGKEGTFTFDGKQIRACTVTERIGYDGAPTVHYVSRDGKYLGSVNETTKVMFVPVERAELEKLWANPDLSRPKPVRPPGGSLDSLLQGK